MAKNALITNTTFWGSKPGGGRFYESRALALAQVCLFCLRNGGSSAESEAGRTLTLRFALGRAKHKVRRQMAKLMVCEEGIMTNRAEDARRRGKCLNCSSQNLDSP